MARYRTHKGTPEGKARTLAHRQARTTKRHVLPLDVETLARELVNAR